MDFVIIGRSEGCKWCDMAEKLLYDTGRTYAFYEAEGPLGGFLQSLGLTTVPQVWYGTESVRLYLVVIQPVTVLTPSQVLLV